MFDSLLSLTDLCPMSLASYLATVHPVHLSHYLIHAPLPPHLSTTTQCDRCLITSWGAATCQALDKLADKSIVVFDSLLASYHLLADTVRSQPPEKEIEFLLIDCTQVGTSQRRYEWR